MRVHHVNNVNTVLAALESSGVKLVNISAADVVDGNPKLILGERATGREREVPRGARAERSVAFRTGVEHHRALAGARAPARARARHAPFHAGAYAAGVVSRAHPGDVLALARGERPSYGPTGEPRS